MRMVHALPLFALLSISESRNSNTAPAPVASPNDNRVASGSLRNGVLTVALEATVARWYPI